MPKTVNLYTVKELSDNNEILLKTNSGIELHIIEEEDRTIITLPFGNKFDIIDGDILIYTK